VNLNIKVELALNFFSLASTKQMFLVPVSGPVRFWPPCSRNIKYRWMLLASGVLVEDLFHRGSEPDLNHKWPTGRGLQRPLLSSTFQVKPLPLSALTCLFVQESEIRRVVTLIWWVPFLRPYTTHQPVPSCPRLLLLSYTQNHEGANPEPKGVLQSDAREEPFLVPQRTFQTRVLYLNGS